MYTEAKLAEKRKSMSDAEIRAASLAVATLLDQYSVIRNEGKHPFVSLLVAATKVLRALGVAEESDEMARLIDILTGLADDGGHDSTA